MNSEAFHILARASHAQAPEPTRSSPLWPQTYVFQHLTDSQTCFHTLPYLSAHHRGSAKHKSLIELVHSKPTNNKLYCTVPTVGSWRGWAVNRWGCSIVLHACNDCTTQQRLCPPVPIGSNVNEGFGIGDSRGLRVRRLGNLIPEFLVFKLKTCYFFSIL